MSSPYWSPPTPAEHDPAPRWQQPPHAAHAAEDAAEPTLELIRDPRTEPTVSFGAQPPGVAYSPADPWPRSAVTAPIPYEGDPRPYRDVATYQQPYSYPSRPHPPHLSPSYPPQPYPVAGQPVLWSGRSRVTAGVLAFFLGLLGVHNFYLGHVARGVVQLVLSLTGVGLVVSWIWVVVDFVLILTGGLRDRDGRLLR